MQFIGMEWEELQKELSCCRLCPLCESRRNAVLGRGSQKALILFIGEGPGEQEDIEGLPFVGRAGKLLDLALQGLMFPPDSYYIANIVKCRPPNNRTPTDDEALSCLPWLRRQTRLIAPKIIVCLGAVALKHIIGREYRITQARGQWISKGGFRFMPTFHPAAILRDDNKKPLMWQDLKKVRDALETGC